MFSTNSTLVEDRNSFTEVCFWNVPVRFNNVTPFLVISGCFSFRRVFNKGNYFRVPKI